MNPDASLTCESLVKPAWSVDVWLVQDLQYDVESLTDDYSNFRGDESIDSSNTDDKILYDTIMINGILSLENSKRTSSTTIAKQTFLLFAKTLHELGHASIFKSGRLMRSNRLHMNKRNELFSTPATHALSAEVGNAIERFLFGSIIGTVGRQDGNLFIIKEILLQEQKPSGIIDSSWLKAFTDLDLTSLNAIPLIIYTPLTKKRLKAAKSSPKSLEEPLTQDEDENDDNEDDDDDDDDDEPVLKSTN
ncbi:unnamed protein product [Rotaria sp. Silwood2]|nr:unnamed protein product [Rotaria sp. Silwood2]CAF4094798.1 unnamed protein product [Rotaria sp. Silwood2]